METELMVKYKYSESSMTATCPFRKLGMKKKHTWNGSFVLEPPPPYSLLENLERNVMSFIHIKSAPPPPTPHAHTQKQNLADGKTWIEAAHVTGRTGFSLIPQPPPPQKK